MVIKQIADLQHYRNDQMNRVYSPDGLYPTLKTVSGGEREVKVYDGERYRKLTPTEYFRLTGFTDADVELLVNNGISQTQIYKMAGNSIPVKMLEHLFDAVYSDSEKCNITNNIVNIKEGSKDMQIKNVNIYDLEESIRASKYPKSVDTESVNEELTDTAIKLAAAPKGSGHDNWLKGILIAFDLRFTIKEWTEAERYHFFEIVSSQSTMHCMVKFDLDQSYCEYVDPRMIDIMKEKVAAYQAEPSPENYLKVLYSNPCGFYLTARISTNYQQLKTIYAQRKTHRLPNWRAFCKWIETLPHSELITGKGEENEQAA